MKKLLLLLFVFISAFNSEGNNKLDELRKELQGAKSDTIKSRLLIEIGLKQKHNYTDSSFYYLDKAKNILSSDNSHSILLKLNAEIAKAHIYYLRKSNAQRAIEILDSVLPVLDTYIISEEKAIARKALQLKIVGNNYLGDSYRFTGRYNEAVDYHNEAFEYAQLLEDDTESKAMCYMYLGNIYRYTGEFEKAIENNTLAMESFINIDDEMSLASVYNNMGNVYHMQGNYSKALEFYQKALHLFEKFDDLIRAGSGYYNISVVNFFMQNYDAAKQFALKALSIREELEDIKGMINSYMLIGVVSHTEGDIDEAISQFKGALKLAKEINDLSGIGHGYMRLAVVYQALEDYTKALEYHLKSFEVFEETNNYSGQISSSNNISLMYYLLGNISLAIKYADNSYVLSDRINALSPKLEASQLLTKSYENRGDYKTALKYSKETFTLYDSIYSKERANIFSEMQTRFETEKKQLEIENLTKEKALQETEIARQKEEVLKQRILTYSLLVGFVVIVVFLYFLHNLYKEKKKANILLIEQNLEINQKNEEIKSQRDEITSQRDYVISQKNLIEASHQRITDSINYAKLIQSALLPSDKILKYFLPESFVYYKPRDIVSGDFYWIKQINDYTILVTADCTGHGVPGAFMSMLGIAFLNEITRRDSINKASDILENLKQEVVNSLYQTSHEDKANDGMDMGVLFLNKKTSIAQFAGAKSPLYIVRKGAENDITGETEKIVLKEKDDIVLIEIKGEQQSVSLTPFEKQFVNHEIQLKKNDSIYLFSDGFIDQLNAKTTRRYNTERFKSLLLDMYNTPMDKQSSLLNNAYESWRNGNEQIDDIVIIGVKV